MHSVTVLEKPKCCLWCITKSLELMAVGYRFYTCECDHCEQSYHSKFSKYLIFRQLLIIAMHVLLMYGTITKLMSYDVGSWTYMTRIIYLSAASCNIIAQMHSPLTTRTRVRAMKLLEYVLKEFNNSGSICSGNEETKGLQFRFLLGTIILVTLLDG